MHVVSAGTCGSCCATALLSDIVMRMMHMCSQERLHQAASSLTILCVQLGQCTQQVRARIHVSRLTGLPA